LQQYLFGEFTVNSCAASHPPAIPLFVKPGGCALESSTKILPGVELG